MDFLLIIIIGLTAIASFKGFNDATFFRKYEFHIGSIKAGEQIRMITSGFLHVDIMHFAFNMFTLYIFAPHVLQAFGNFYFVITYLISMVSGSLLTLYIHKNENHYRAVGASGAVTGVVYSAILLFPEMDLYLFFIPIPIPGYIFGIGYLLYSIYGMKNKNDNVGHTAHFGGAIGGYLVTLIKVPDILFTNTKMVILLLIPITLLIYMYKQNKL